MPLPDHVEKIRASVSNWDRWGPADERGTANLLTEAAARRGAAAVRDGRRIDLALALGAGGPQIGRPPGRINPRLAFTALDAADPNVPGPFHSTDEVLTMSTCAGTHVDALAHVSYDGLLYNGYPSSSITAEEGATRCGAEKIPAFVTRGVLLDLPTLRGVAGLDELDPGFALSGADLDECCDAAGVHVEPGDVALVRTGEIRHFLAGDRNRYVLGDRFRFPGPSLASVQWFARHDVAGVFCDSYPGEAFPPPSPDWSDSLCVHLLQLRDMGLFQGQNWNLEALSSACAEAGRWDFLLLAAPEPITGAASAPVRPVAVL